MSDSSEREARTAYDHYVGNRSIVNRDDEKAHSTLEKMLQDTFSDEYSALRDPHFALMRCVQWWSIYVGPTPRQHELDPNRTLLWQQLHGFLHYLDAISIHNGSICTTSAGFLGITAMEANEGDVVAIVDGCSLPLLLRPHVDATYTFCGLMFIGELLSGQLKNIWLKNGINEQTITLR